MEYQRNHSSHEHRHQGDVSGDHQNHEKMGIGDRSIVCYMAEPGEGRALGKRSRECLRVSALEEPYEANPGKQMEVSSDDHGVALPRGRGHPDDSV